MAEASERWAELRLDVPVPADLSVAADAMERHLEPLTRACLAVAPGGLVIEGADAPPGDLPVPAPGWVRLRVYVPQAEQEGAAASLQAPMGAYPEARMTLCSLEDGWQERWKAWFRGFDVSSALSVRPPWEPARRLEGIELVIEPGMAFGTGQHATTKLCLRWLVTQAEAGTLPERVLDVGCGTGILSICARLLGAVHVDGLDVDEKAVVLARENAALNGVREGLAFGNHPLAASKGGYPLVVANILAHVLRDLAEDLVRCTERDGILVLSGMTREQEADVEACFVALGMVTAARSAEEDWVLLAMRRSR